MVRILFLCFAVGLGALTTGIQSVEAGQTVGAPGLAVVARASYTVWYKAPGKRWTGVSGLSYYDATRVLDQYLARGWSAYIEKK